MIVWKAPANNLRSVYAMSELLRVIDSSDATAPTLEGCLDPLREDVGRRVGIGGEDRDGQRGRRREPRGLGTGGQTLDTTAEHVGAAERVERQVGGTQAAQHAGRPFDGVGDVVQLQVEEHPETHLGESAIASASAGQ